MNRLSRSALAAVAVLASVPAGIGIAKSIENTRSNELSPDARARLDEGRIAMAKAALKLSAEQEKLWAPIEAQARDAMKSKASHRAERWQMREQFEKDRAEGKRPDMAERLDKLSQRLSERAERMKNFSTAFRPFYASLSDEQKDVLRPLMNQMAPGFGKRGHGGPRHAWFGGWGPGGGPNGRSIDFERKGPEGGAAGGGRPPELPQHAPDFSDDDPLAGDDR